MFVSMDLIIISVFILGYVLIAFEHQIKVNKTATALVLGVLCWSLFALSEPTASSLHNSIAETHNNSDGSGIIHEFVKTELAHTLSQISGILFFLIGAMTIVELVDTHQGFRFITDRITTRNIRKLLWIICWAAFFLSALLDNLTTAIVMVSLTRKLIHDTKQRMFFAGMIIIAANAGGAWSPLGDVTTTMLWIGGQISAGAIIKSLIIPSVVCLVVPLVYLSFTLKGSLEPNIANGDESGSQSPAGSRTMFFAGVGALISVPIFKSLVGLPPYMGMLLGLGVLWVISELINPHLDSEEKRKYSAAHALSRIDVSSILFFMGILLAVSALETMHVLSHLASYLDESIGDYRIIVTIIGAVSAVVDNVPLVAASIGMYSLDLYPTDHAMWKYLAYCAGTGGSLLIIGSAAGVAVMGMEKIDFVWYFKKMTLLALMGYVAGAIVYLMQLSW